MPPVTLASKSKVAGATPSVSLEVISTVRGSAGDAINSKERNTCLAATGNGVGAKLLEATVCTTELPS